MWKIANKKSYFWNFNQVRLSAARQRSGVEEFSQLVSLLRSYIPSRFLLGLRDGCPEMGIRRVTTSARGWEDKSVGFCRRSIENRSRLSGFMNDSFGYSVDRVRGFAGAAEAVVSSTDEDVSAIEEIQGMLEELSEEVVRKKAEKCEGKNKHDFGDLGAAKYGVLKKRQIKIETEGWEQAAREYRELMMDMCKKKLAPNLPYMKSLFLGWFEPLRNRVAAEQELRRRGKLRSAYAPYIDNLPAEMMAVITMHKLMGLMMTSNGNGSARVVQAACSIGEAIENEARIHKFFEKSRKKSTMANEGEKEPEAVTKEKEFLRKKVTTLIKKQKLRQVTMIVKGKDDSEPWGTEGHVKIGCRLIELLIETAYIQPPLDQVADGPPDIRPAFRHSLKSASTDNTNNSRRYGIIECDPLVRKGLERTARHMVIPFMPMLVPPLNWTGYDKGAYLFLPSHVMRTHGARQQREAIKNTPRNQLQSVFEALDTLGSMKWRVNKRVLAIVDRIWASGGNLAGLVDCQDVPLPEKPDTEDDDEVLKKWKWKLKNAKKENSERHALRCDVELKLSVARRMKDEEGFYYPHNLDFRGRAYPMHPYLNHLGSDICRGILEFAQGRPLGKSGLHWLKIHIANLYGGGVDKLSYDGRLEFVENHLDDIFDSADRPLEGSRWWLGAEDPFQCLAACMNLSEALRSLSPEATISHVPVHQDGSCNGLQHYAALGRDKLGAAAVNLVAGEKPADVYSGIAARVLEIMQKDAQNDPTNNPSAARARLLVDQVDRKLVKQTVMTSVYGVTYIGARDQIKKRLKERGTLPDEQVFGASCYAARTTLTALEEMFQAARAIMSWLGDCAKVIATENESVRWITPLGLPVVQPYKKKGRCLVKTSLQVLALQRETDKVMIKRQRTAFPPNFVHSLDGSHMMMTAIACKKAGLNFAGVHDSYWTHACDVDEMNRILREKFVELYEQPILENLLKDFEKTFPKLQFPPLPDRGNFDLKEVLQSTYFFN